MNNKVIVIGGGAAGMMAAIVARKNGSDVTILERNDRIGKKLLATGNGRCNYTNIYLSIDNYHGENKKFAYSALSSLDKYATMDFFERLGISPSVDISGKVFPLSFQSSSVLDIFRLEIENLNIELITEAYVEKIYKNKDKFNIILEDKKKFECDKVILATGGKAMPNSGSDGNGYDIAMSFGHNIIKPIPGLVQLNLEDEDKLFKKITGVKVPGKVSLYIDNEYIKEDSGDVLFTNYGISGPPILQLSSHGLKALDKGKDVRLKVSLIEEMTEDVLINYLENRFKNIPNRTMFESLIGLINKKLINPVLEITKINKEKKAGNITKQEIISLAKQIVSWEFKVIGSQGWKHAQVTSGGIDTKDINPSTMESNLVSGLYIVGEILDIDGDCGGFNLQWAWSSGYVAGLDASLE